MGENLKTCKVIPAQASIMLRSRNARRFCSRGYKPRAKRSSGKIIFYRQF
ncbi:MAG: hypothetical protein ACYDEG_02695 [bacterium]